MSTTIYTKNIEREGQSNNKIDLSLFRKKSSAKTFKGIVIGFMKKITNSEGQTFSKREVILLFQELYKKIGNLETSERFKQKIWKGKSGIKFLVYPNKVICVSYQKFEPGETPKEIRTELTKEDINKVISTINKLDKGKEIISPLIAEKTYG